TTAQTNAALQTWTVALDQHGNANVPAPGYTTTVVGMYQWVATYSGDANNDSSTSGCGKESVVIHKVDTDIRTEQSNSGGAPVGTAIRDTAILHGDAPTGAVTFFLYGPNDPNCVD